MKNYVKAMSRHLPQALVGLPSVLLLIVFLSPSPGLSDDPLTVAPDSGPWQPDLGFEFKKKEKKTKGEPDPFGAGFEGLVPNLRRRYEEGSWVEQESLEPYRALRPCPSCQGARLKPQSRAVRVKGRTMTEYVDLPI